MEAYLGIDVGSITVKFAVLNAVDDLLESLYLPAAGKPVDVVQQGLGQIGRRLSPDIDIKGVAATGSARYLAGALVGPATFLPPGGGRWRVGMEDFPRRSLAGKDKVNISGRCTVFAESDMVHKQQMGYKVDDIIFGLCRTLARNYLSDVGSGKDIQPPVVFQGGVAFNKGIIRALHEELKTEIIVPPHHEVMGAIGAALLAHEAAAQRHSDCRFRGFDISAVG